MKDMLLALSTVSQQVLTLFILLALGFILGKTKIITKEGSHGLTNLVMYIVTPAMNIYAFQQPYVKEDMHNFLIVGAGAVVSIVVLALIGRICIHDGDEGRRRTLRFALQFTNCGYMGYPLLNAIIGPRAVFFGSAYVAVFNILSWSWGVYAITGDRKMLKPRKMFLNPGVIGVVIALALYLMQIQLPDIINTPLHYMAEMNTPLPMVIVGYQLSHANFKRALSGVWTWVTLGLCLIVTPLITLGAVLVLGLEPLIAMVLVIIMATPPAAVLSLFSQLFGKDTELASAVVSVYTLFSVVTMPLMIGLAQYLLY